MINIQGPADPTEDLSNKTVDLYAVKKIVEFGSLKYLILFLKDKIIECYSSITVFIKVLVYIIK